MEDRLRMYIDELFGETKPTRKTVELKEEMVQNLEDKYKDLLAEGKSPDVAFNIAIAGIGDVSNLLRQLEEGFLTDAQMQKQEQAKHRSALLTAVAVMMYIICALPVILFGNVPVMLVMIAAATGILIYNNMTKPQPYKDSDTIVEDFREWQAGAHEHKQLRSAISSALWSIIVAAYFIISFTTHAWHITWVIFIIGGLIESLISVFFAMKNK